MRAIRIILSKQAILIWIIESTYGATSKQGEFDLKAKSRTLWSRERVKTMQEVGVSRSG
jgi:hypothetical protein